MDITADMLRKFIALGLNKDQILGIVEMWDELNPAATTAKEKNRERVRRWRERLNLSPSEWRDRCAAVKIRDEFTCVYCGTADGQMHVDHVVPLIQGGTSELDNLVTACRECNCGKSGRTVEEWRA